MDLVRNDRSRELRERIGTINRMILEIARGNFIYQIARSNQADELEGLVASLNMMAEELKSSLLQRGNRPYKNDVGMIFVLDADFRIQVINALVRETLHLHEQDIKGKSITDFLAQESANALLDLKKQISDTDLTTSIELFFKTDRNLVVPMVCSVSVLAGLPGKNRMLIVAFETVLHRKEAEEEMLLAQEYEDRKDDSTVGNFPRPFNNRLCLREEDISKIRAVRDYLLTHMDQPGSLKDLARNAGINDFKLKNGFKQLYGTTVFGFLYEERMQRAKNMLADMTMPIKEMSVAIGYKNLSNFTAAYKKRFGYPPSFERKKQTNKAEEKALESLSMLV
jgi:AraC-like DNA-binding protein/PAS domain-containing protein